MYPLYHPDRPYFVNLAYLYELIFDEIFSVLIEFSDELFSLNLNYYYSKDIQRHYLKYLENYGPEEKLPGFLMTNQQMIQFIQAQTHCNKFQHGGISRYYLEEGGVFNCP